MGYVMAVDVDQAMSPRSASPRSIHYPLTVALKYLLHSTQYFSCLHDNPIYPNTYAFSRLLKSTKAVLFRPNLSCDSCLNTSYGGCWSRCCVRRCRLL